MKVIDYVEYKEEMPNPQKIVKIFNKGKTQYVLMPSTYLRIISFSLIGIGFAIGYILGG